MPYLVSFENFTPQPRFDGLPWSTVQIAESTEVGGVYTVIDTVTLSPLDSDPTNPAPRSFSAAATLPSGWYTVTFLDTEGTAQAFGPIYHQADRANWTPGLGDVGALLRSRTVDNNGVETGTFTTATRPTGSQVKQLINMAISFTPGSTIGYQVPAELWDTVAYVIALRSALMVELSFFPEQVRSLASPYAQLKLLYDEAVQALKEAKLELGATISYEPTATYPLIY